MRPLASQAIDILRKRAAIARALAPLVLLLKDGAVMVHLAPVPFPVRQVGTGSMESRKPRRCL